MSFLAQFRKKLSPPKMPMLRARVVDDVVGALNFDGEHWFAGSMRLQESRLPVIIAASESDIHPASLATARKASTELPGMVERAFHFLASFPGFGRIEKVRQIFVIAEAVFDGKDGCFYLVFHCTEDRDPEAAWRVHFERWQPFPQGRDS